jgi:hypothetical protein
VGLRRLAIMANVGYAAAALEMREVQTAARTLGLDAADPAVEITIAERHIQFERSDSRVTRVVPVFDLAT